MEKQIKLYSMSLGMAKTKREKRLSDKRNKFLSIANNIKKYYANEVRKELKLKKKEWNNEAKIMFKELVEKDVRLAFCNDKADKIKKDLHNLYAKNTSVRKIKTDDFKNRNNIALFENDLTRILNISQESSHKDFVIIEAKKHDDILLNQVIIDGLMIDNEKYIFFTAGAGQTRKQKFVMMKESLWNKYEKTLMCGLTIEQINKKGSLNINKYLAYLALLMTASYIKEGFDIDKCIVVDDFETMVEGEVDYITRNDKVDDGVTTYIRQGKECERKKTKVKWNIERKKMNVPIPHMDGCGICLPSFSNKKNIQVRLPWIKGLLTPCDYLSFCKTERKVEDENRRYKVKDMWDKEWDLIEDDIEVIFTKSQFKLWKFYKDWDNYKSAFKKYNRTCNICKEDSKEYKNMYINYQMLQTLTNITDENIEIITGGIKKTINEVHYNRQAQLNFLGANGKDDSKNNFQECLRLYPEMLKSAYVKKQLSDAITSIKKSAKSGRIKLNSKRTFIIPDVVAFMEWLFNEEETPAGVLKGNEVYCNLYKNDDRLAVLRSPHLSREWAIRPNKRKESKIKWFMTNGIYTSSHDLISKMLTFDNDGDEALVISNKEKWLLDLAEQQMEDIRPLYYEMGKAGAKDINTQNILDSLKFVYHKSNIGKISNCITNIWNNGYENNMDNIKLLTAYNNFIIDSAKTLEIPKLPKELKTLTQSRKYPYFFQWAKNKSEHECEKQGEGVMDRICRSIDDIPYQKFVYNKSFGTFRVGKLLNNSKIEIDDDVIEMYLILEEVVRKRLGEIAELGDEDDDIFKMKAKESIYDDAERLIKKYSEDKGIEYIDIVDMIIKYAFKNDELRLAFIFEVFGKEIINNINKNVPKSVDKEYILCVCCGKRVKKTNNRMKMCEKCSKEIKKQNDKNRNSIKKNELKAS